MGFIELLLVLVIGGLFLLRFGDARALGRGAREFRRLLPTPAAVRYELRRLAESRLGMVVWTLLVALGIVERSAPALIAAALIFAWCWFVEVRMLLGASDDMFAGRNDKLIWGLYLLFCPPIGLVLFREFRERNWAPVKERIHDLA